MGNRAAGVAEGVGFEPTVRLPVRLISSQVPSTNSATLPLHLNQGPEDSVNRRLVEGLVRDSGASKAAALRDLRKVRDGRVYGPRQSEGKTH
jgi:hypothetical protein